jgi:gentisate 1,2-dioxygenase
MHMVEGSAKVLVDEAVHDVQETDTLAVPTHAMVLASNASASKPAYLFIVDDAPLQRKMGIYEVFE